MSPRWLTAIVAAFQLFSLVLAQIPSLPFDDCSSPSSDPTTKINISTIFAQISNARARFLNLTLLGDSGSEIFYSSNATSPLLSTVFAPTQVLTFTLNPNSQSQFALCSTLRPPSPLSPLSYDPNRGYCPIPAGPVAFSVSVPLSRSYELMTLNTQIRVLDTSDPAKELACLNVAATPLPLAPGSSVYGQAIIVFWCTVALAIAYWTVVGAGRLSAAWRRGRQRVHNTLYSRLQAIGFVFASAISGERFASNPALMRFGTPSMRDIIFHTQWCTLLGMVAVQWPRFAYPFFAQTAWSSLLYNISLTQGSDATMTHWYPLHTGHFNPPTPFADQITDPASPLFLDVNIPNSIFTLPSGIPQSGIPALAATVGIRSQDVFNNAMALFLIIMGGTIAFSLFIFIIDWLLGFLAHSSERNKSGTRTSHWSPKEYLEPALAEDELSSAGVRFQHRPASRTMREISIRSGWLSQQLGQNSFHGSVLHGNLVRVLMLFHLPVTIFSCYQFSSGKSHSSLAAVILAAVSFTVFSVAIPAILVLRLSTTPTNKLYDETRTLLALGPLYNHYAHGSQLFACLFFACNIAYGVALGCGQQSGTAQSIIILVVEVASALTTSVWLPWGRGATMGSISFMLCVARIITAVLLVILSPIVAVGDAAGGWITYAILVIQGLVYSGFLLMLVFKVLEGLVRLAWDVPFDRSKHAVDTGFFGALGLVSRRKREYRRKGNMASGMHRPSRAGSDVPVLQAAAVAAASRSRTTVSGPPSVLRPEHLNQPYREESDDETGYILGAWHYDDDLAIEPFPPPSPSPPPQPTSSFSRVAGGRANIESPYTMTTGTNTAFGNLSPIHKNSPSGTMPPGRGSHARRKSQSAIIEDASTLYNPKESPEVSGSNVDTPRRKNWLSRALFPDARRRVPSSAETTSGMADQQVPSSEGSGGRTFVVIRERKPSPLSQAQLPEGQDTASPPDEGTRSFTLQKAGVVTASHE